MKTHRYKELGDFLRTRRGKISPLEVGLSPGLRRRTPGLRREEVAALAGVGLTWYTWLEQGRQINVSVEVLESLARVLKLDQQERIHLYTLANRVPPVDVYLYQESEVSMLQHVLDNLTISPSFIMDSRWNIILWNKAAEVVFGNFDKINECERNMVYMMFKNDNYKQLFIDWDLHAQGMLARFRSTTVEYVDEPWFVKFIEELREKSEEFNLWWSKHDVQTDNGVYKKIRHPIAEEMIFEFCSFNVCDKSNLKLIVNTPLLGTDTDIKVKSLLGFET
ncbi:helix-turn-helix transcriptional regulator [Clostridium sp. JS66]|uniref:helix-turn-helix transcriptional regulator n=1 Tax=Clostridium sp. JS66 TaxID=3064705 RepID=UPI00298E0D62|nr:helix-turn-helix transcriptional regulator [Clostridium sp. JS66]WPC42189.1 helix-turn-helix transcriptional regulator [Clostridium sp. JS66]